MTTLSGQIPITNRTFIQSTSRAAASILFQNSSFANFARAEARFFGANVSQDINNVYIKKSDLSLDISKAHTAEALFLALLLQAKNYESDNTSRIEIKFFKREWITINTIPIQQDVFIINLYADLAYSDSPNPGIIEQIVNANTPITPNDFSG